MLPLISAIRLRFKRAPVIRDLGRIRGSCNANAASDITLRVYAYARARNVLR